MIQLCLFGNVSLVDGGGKSRDDLLAQQKRAALLAYLAVGKSGGAHSRESLMALFWPELTEKRARSALNQALYYLRTALGSEAIHSRLGEQVRISTAEIECDVTIFESHLSRGELKAAVALYRGPFMEGFFLSGLPAFERWVEGERDRLGEKATRAVWQLADQAAASGNAEEAIGYARRGMELSHDEGSVRRLIAIRDRFGDRVGAIREYDRFARQIARELEAEPSPETQDLVQQIRSRTISSGTPPLGQKIFSVSPQLPPIPEPPQLSPGSRSSEPSQQTSSTAPETLATALRIGPFTSSTNAAGRRLFRAVAVLLPAGLLTLWLTTLASGDKPAPTKVTRVAIMPFSYTGDPARASATMAVASLLDADINGAGGMKTIDWRKIADAERKAADFASPDQAAYVARKNNADLFVVGTVNEAVGRYRITSALYSAFDPSTPQVTAIVECDTNALFAAVDTIAARLFGGKNVTTGAGTDPVIRLQSDSSPPAPSEVR